MENRVRVLHSSQDLRTRNNNHILYRRRFGGFREIPIRVWI